MWVEIATGWISAAAMLYSYMVLTAGDPPRAECMDCDLLDCSECPYVRAADEDLSHAA